MAEIGLRHGVRGRRVGGERYHGQPASPAGKVNGDRGLVGVGVRGSAWRGRGQWRGRGEGRCPDLLAPVPRKRGRGARLWTGLGREHGPESTSDRSQPPADADLGPCQPQAGGANLGSAASTSDRVNLGPAAGSRSPARTAARQRAATARRPDEVELQRRESGRARGAPGPERGGVRRICRGAESSRARICRKARGRDGAPGAESGKVTGSSRSARRREREAAGAERSAGGCGGARKTVPATTAPANAAHAAHQAATITARRSNCPP